MALKSGGEEGGGCEEQLLRVIAHAAKQFPAAETRQLCADLLQVGKP